MRRLDRHDFDVIVLGTGLSGTIMASILARHGRSVLMLDSGVHPRFAIGESTIPQTSQLIQLLSRKYDVPELAILGLKSPLGLREQVTLNCGVKRVVGFAYHELGNEHSPAHEHQFGNVWRTENHLFRQDVDAWLLTVAMHYGCHVLQGVGIESVDVHGAGVKVVTVKGETFSGRFIVDATGHRSVLAASLGLREEPCSMETSSRSMFTHVVGLKDIEEVAQCGMSHKFSEGTLHHIFKRGWFWVIPFNNWEGAKNPLVSVGLTLDDRVYPEDPELSAEDEFSKFLDMVPSVARQFADAQVVRPWIRSKRIQYMSTVTTGARFALLSNAAGFVDPLFSRGLICTVENIYELCEVLLPALEDGDFSDERFAPVDVQQKRALSFADRIVNASYISWDDFEIWNLWVRVWAIGVHVVESNLGSVIAMGGASKVKPVSDPLFSPYEESGYKNYFNESYAAMCKYDKGELSAAEARKTLASVLDAYEFQIPLRDRCMGQEWAMKNPLVRDVFLGVSERHERWVNGRTDDHPFEE